MPKKVRLTIDGKEVRASEGTSLLDAGEAADIHIPNLCNLKGMLGCIGACRLCYVEVEGLSSPVTACTTKAKEGMVVHTQTDAVREIRRYVIDLILSMHPLDCMTCTKAGVCQLQKYAYEFGIQESSFSRKKFGFPVDDSNPFIKLDPDYCILCGRCVRICREQGTSVLDYYGRGVGSRVVTAGNKPLHESACTFCGSCVEVCPVNALLEADRWDRGREWEYEKHASVCLLCGNACDLFVSVKDETVAKVNVGAEQDRADYFICMYGRFGFNHMRSGSRVKEPLKRASGELTPVKWDDALKDLADALKNPDDVGIVASGSLLNEDILTIVSFADALGIKSVGSTVSLYADGPSLLGRGVDIEKADLVVLVGLQTSQHERVLPALDAVLRKKAARACKLVVINSASTAMSEVANVTMTGDEMRSLAGIARALVAKGLEAPKGIDFPHVDITEGMARAAEMIVEASAPVFVSVPSLYEACRCVAALKGTALSVPFEANAKGALMMGLDGEGMKYSELASGNKRVLYVIGEAPLARPRGVDFFVVQAPYLAGIANEADIVLPPAVSFESEGTVVDYMGRLKTLERAVPPAGGSKLHREILVAVAAKAGVEIKAARTADTRKIYRTFALAEKPPRFIRRDELAFDPGDIVPSECKLTLADLLSIQCESKEGAGITGQNAQGS